MFGIAKYVHKCAELEYEVRKGDNKEFIGSMCYYDYENDFDYDYSITEEKEKKGRVVNINRMVANRISQFGYYSADNKDECSYEVDIEDRNIKLSLDKDKIAILGKRNDKTIHLTAIDTDRNITEIHTFVDDKLISIDDKHSMCVYFFGEDGKIGDDIIICNNIKVREPKNSGLFFINDIKIEDLKFQPKKINYKDDKFNIKYDRYGITCSISNYRKYSELCRYESSITKGGNIRNINSFHPLLFDYFNYHYIDKDPLKYWVLESMYIDAAKQYVVYTRRYFKLQIISSNDFLDLLFEDRFENTFILDAFEI